MDVRELYQEIILDHSRKPRNHRRIEGPSSSAEGHNPLCGDSISVTLLVNDGRVDDIAFEGHGCAISTASASMMTEAVKGKTTEQAEEIFRTFQRLVTGEDAEYEPVELGDLEVLAGVRAYPVRIKCATLPWHTLNAALKGGDESITTED